MGGCRAKNKQANLLDTVLAYSYALFQFYFPNYVLNKVFSYYYQYLHVNIRGSTNI